MGTAGCRVRPWWLRGPMATDGSRGVRVRGVEGGGRAPGFLVPGASGCRRPVGARKGLETESKTGGAVL